MTALVYVFLGWCILLGLVLTVACAEEDRAGCAVAHNAAFTVLAIVVLVWLATHGGGHPSMSPKAKLRPTFVVGPGGSIVLASFLQRIGTRSPCATDGIFDPELPRGTAWLLSRTGLTELKPDGTTGAEYGRG